jgi:hypothetical protein
MEAGRLWAWFPPKERLGDAGRFAAWLAPNELVDAAGRLDWLAGTERGAGLGRFIAGDVGRFWLTERLEADWFIPRLAEAVRPVGA